MPGEFTILLGKDAAITGVDNARSCTVTSSASEIDVTKFGDTSRKYRRGLIEQSIEVECVDDPGVEAGDPFTISGTITGNVTYICTGVVRDEPLDDIITYKVSGKKTVAE
jgi:Tfp pilus assembly protein PilW